MKKCSETRIYKYNEEETRTADMIVSCQGWKKPDEPSQIGAKIERKKKDKRWNIYKLKSGNDASQKSSNPTQPRIRSLGTAPLPP